MLHAFALWMKNRVTACEYNSYVFPIFSTCTNERRVFSPESKTQKGINCEHVIVQSVVSLCFFIVAF